MDDSKKFQNLSVFHLISEVRLCKLENQKPLSLILKAFLCFYWGENLKPLKFFG
jgi:hypothetical protein